MKAILVTGSREWLRRDAIHQALLDEQSSERCDAMLLIHGGARGADHIADLYARESGWNVLPMLPDKTAPYTGCPFRKRNAEMVRVAQALTATGWTVKVHAFPTEESRGTWHCYNLAKRAGLDCEVHRERG